MANTRLLQIRIDDEIKECIDRVVAAETEILGSKKGRTMSTVARDALVRGLNDMLARLQRAKGEPT